MQETRVRSLGWEDPLEKEMATHSSIFCLGNSTDRGAWWATIHGITKELDTTEQLNNTTTYDEGQASSAEVQILNSKKSQTATGNPKGMMLYLEVNDVWGLGLTRR